ncbi:MAG: site-specific integrase [Planctomycetota bacterium]|nr:site-specific integrase [Planctomycetota bacterium]
MARPKSLVPRLCIDKSRNRAFCKVDGKFIVLGPAGSPAAQAAYGRLLTDLAQHGSETAVSSVKRRGSALRESQLDFTLNDLFLRFVTEELPRYSKAEQFCLKSAIKIARELYGETSAAEFGPLRFRTIRDGMIRKGWSRSFINKEMKRLRMIVRWGVGWELVPQTVADALSAVKSLGYGDTDAPESKPRQAVPESDLLAVRAVLSELHRDIFDVMLMTGCRPGELLGLTTGMIDRSGEIWRAELTKHKTSHQGKSRTLHFNVTAQSILRKYLTANPDERLYKIRRDSFGNAVKRACLKAGVPKFTPHWLRHCVATRLTDEMGTEAAQRLLGHASRAMTENYSRAAERQAIEAVKRLG